MYKVEIGIESLRLKIEGDGNVIRELLDGLTAIASDLKTASDNAESETE